MIDESCGTDVPNEQIATTILDILLTALRSAQPSQPSPGKPAKSRRQHKRREQA
jgi:hypothetical protein